MNGDHPIIPAGGWYGYTVACPLKAPAGSLTGWLECGVMDKTGEWGGRMKVQLGKVVFRTLEGKRRI